jgi:hypothetical protein
MGVLPWEDLKTALNLNTGFFETSRYTLSDQMAITSGNHDQAGMSAGNLQYNYGAADRLQELWAFMIANHPTVVQAAFGANTAEHAEFVNVTNTYTRTQRVTWADSITDYAANAEGRYLKEPWKSIFSTLLNQPETITKYLAMSDAYYFPNPYDVFRQLSCKSRAALAGIFDITVNKGRYYPFNLIQVDFDEIDANENLTETEKEAQKIYQINFRGNEEENALNDTSSAVFWERRGCMANQGGDYYGALYEPENQFDINQEPATTEKAATTAASLTIMLGTILVNNVFLGTTPIEKIYAGTQLLTGGTVPVEPYTTTKVPQTQFRTNAGSYAGIGAVTEISLTVNQPLWVDVQNYVACRTYYTTDGSTPTVNSALYTEALTFQASCTLKVLTVSIFGYAEAVKTLTINIAVAPVTTISPSATVQNNIPITVTLSTSEQGAAIKYKLGSSATVYNYTAPFQVNQTSAGVLSTNIKVTYWAVGASATEAEKSITYDTANAVPVAPVVTATPTSASAISLSWAATANTTSYTIYRSTISGQLGTILAGTQWMTGTSWNDTTVVEGTTYYYTVQAGNYGRATNSAQVSATPEETASLYRYVRFQGYGDQTNAATTRLVELQAMEGATNRLSGKVPISGEAVSSGGTIDKATDGLTAMTSGTYPLWWVGAGVPNLVYDLGAAYPIDTLKLWMFSTDADPRQTRFKLFVSNDNVNWTPVVDMSSNATPQPTNGWSYAL